MKNPEMSVIICSYNRAVYLKICLEAFFCQPSETLNKVEIIVVDNNSDDNTKEIVSLFSKLAPNIHYVCEPLQGLSNARNRGLKEAKALWVAYVDDDGEVFPNFIECALKVIHEGKYDAFGGVYLPKFSPGKPGWYRDEFASNIKLSYTECNIPYKNQWFSGGICVFKKSALEAVRGFSSVLGMTGKRLAYGEETLVQVRMEKAGFKLGFIPSIKMFHWVLPMKYTLRYFFKKSFGTGRDSWQSMGQQASLGEIFLIYGSTCKRILIALCRLVISWRPSADWRPTACVAELLSALGNALGCSYGYWIDVKFRCNFFAAASIFF